MKKILTTLILFGILAVSGHEFWLQPGRYIYNPGDTALIRFRVGENFEGENWNGNNTRISFLSLYNNGQVKDISDLLSAAAGDSIDLPLPDEGTYIVAYNGRNSYIELDAAKFEAYLLEDGLQDAIAYRKKHRETENMSREYYQRSVKTILQSGKKFDDTYSRVTALPLDIILQVHPYQISKTCQIKAKVLFQGYPYEQALVNIWHRKNNKTIRTQVYTNKHGIVEFPVSPTGQWMVSTVKMLHLENDPRANWQSYWGSCTWGYDQL